MSGLPQVFRATYSNTAVYECMMNEFPIMRRCKDDWVNATQILKCCNFPKAKRTKILEKGVQQGLHEKVQGGFGRFQGTWIPLEDARKLAETYGVTKELAPVLFLDFNDPNLVIPEKAKPAPKENPAIKRKYVKKPKQPGDPPRRYKTGKKAALQAAEEAAAAAAAAAASATGILKTEASSPSGDIILSNGTQTNSNISNGMSLNGSNMNPQPQSGTIQDQFISQEAFGTVTKQNSYIPPSNQQFPQMYNMSQSTPIPSQQLNGNGAALPAGTVNNGFTQAEFQPVRSNGMPAYPTDAPSFQMMQQQHQQQTQQQQQQQSQQQLPPQVIPLQQQKFYPNGILPNNIPQQVFQHGKPLSSQSSNDSSWSVNGNQKESDTSVNSSTDDPKKMQPQEELDSPQTDNSYAAQLLRFFSDDNAPIPYFIVYPPVDFNINETIDDEGHTPLHWAASIGNFDMIHLLMSKGANPLVVNSFGLNPLSKLISFNNCFQLKNFPKVLDDLELCLINTDINGRTPLHYLCQFAKAKSKANGLMYYLKVILNKLTILSNQSQVRQIDLMKNVLNHQDVHGDTCLHIAIRSGSADIAKILLQYGAHDDLENINRETSRQLISQFNLLPNYSQMETVQTTLQQQLQLGMGTYQNINGNTNNNNSNNMPIIPGLATPIQSAYTKSETPDTQRTTVQEDDLDDDDGSVVARVDKRHLDALTDNKENIFVEKQFDNMSTPLNKKQNVGNSHQPLAVISEIDSSTTPSQLPPSQQQILVQSQSAISQHEEQKVETPNKPKSYNPNPPRINDEGKIIEEENGEIPEPKLAMGDLSSMVSGMINSLSDTYSDELKKLEVEKENLKQLIKKKEEENMDSLRNFQSVLANTGIQDQKIESIEQGQELIVETIEICEHTISEKEQALLRVLQRNQAYTLAKLVEEQELKHLDEHNEVDDGNDLINESQVDYAIELTELQLRRNKLVKEISTRTKMFGIDEKMYKYRKLLSLSCGVRVEEIDSLIDGIAESLTEGMS